jgi:hypothetical protein
MLSAFLFLFCVMMVMDNGIINAISLLKDVGFILILECYLLKLILMLLFVIVRCHFIYSSLCLSLSLSLSLSERDISLRE